MARSPDPAAKSSDPAGLRAAILPRALPTPILAYAVRALGADAGGMVTASHNPARDNGYKVYLGGRYADEDGRGVQLVPPADAEIAREIEATGPAADIPLANDYATVGEELVDSYVAECAALVPAGPRDLRIVYTAMHGVGAQIMRRVFAAAGFRDVVEVAEQCEPDPGFPTVAFPNPEEAGALDLAIATARRVGADLIVASDPDADRCAVAAVVDDRWRMLTGDELGLLLADHMIRRGAKGVLASSVVSSGALAALAAARGRDHVTTLTGFKWIGRVPDLAFGYEEAIGYCCDPGAVPDKDGLTAALMVLELAAGLRAEGLTLADRLDELTAELGLHATSQLAIRVSDLSLIADAMARLRENPPTSLLHAPVSYRDLTEGTSGLPPTDAVELSGDEVHVVVRPSGTEPKLKCYLEVRLTPERSRAGAAARLAAEIRMMALRGQMQSVLGLG